ncbi:MAG: hypothetical protein Q9216_006438 [Gyalolechia sp. 2 TL-2023]
MESTIGAQAKLEVQAGEEQDTTAAIETAKATKLDAGLRSLDHYKHKLPPWRYAARQKLIPLIRWETQYVAKLQSAMRSPLLDSYFSITANLGTHTFFMIFLPILFWCGYTNLGRGMVHILASGVIFTGFLKDMLCLPRPLSPPLSRISMSHSASLEYGFPSTHSTNAVSVVVYAIYMLRSVGTEINPTLKTSLEILAYCYATSIILGRLYCGMHGFFDVVIGSILGALLAIVQCLYGEAFDDFLFHGSSMASVIVLVVLVLVRIHPEPADDCPCFDDSVAFAGVMIGVEVGNWHYARTGLAWDLPVPATVPFELHTIGWARTIARIVTGVIIIFAWREIMKPALLKYLPPLFRVVERFGLTLPRKFFVEASMYTKIPTNLKTDSVLPPVSEIPSLLRSLRNPRSHRSVSVGPQSEADAYEALAFRDRRRRESNTSESRLRQTTRNRGSSDKFDDPFVGEMSPSNPPKISRRPGLPTPASSQTDLYGNSLTPDVLLDGALTPSTLHSAMSTPRRRLSEDRRQYERDEKEIFSMLEKPRVRYDVEVITKLIVYADSTKGTLHSSQYGIQQGHGQADSSLYSGGRAADERLAEGGTNAPQDALAHLAGHDFYKPQRRLSSTSSRSSKRTGSPVDRIIEHEEAVTSPSKRNNDGPTFTVIRRTTSGSQRVNLIDFPNEVLTHILSHLPAPTLSDVSLVSRRFHSLVTSPHAWRIAFSRHFPAQKALTLFDQGLTSEETDFDTLRSERRVFNRLTALASWRSEYILRTQLLRSLGRGKPANLHEAISSGPSRSSPSYTSSAQITYNSNLVTTVNHLHATFSTSLNKRLPNFIHGADETGSACLSDPRIGKVDHWGSADPQGFVQFADGLPGIPEYGLGPGPEVGVPNAMDISRQYGMVYSEGTPGGRVYHRSVEERRGRFLAGAVRGSWPELGIPDILGTSSTLQTPCSVWIAKTTNVPDCSEGLIGLLSGSSRGVISAYSLGTNGLGERRIERGEITCRWIVSPGVPIIGLCVDDNITAKRLGSRRIWAVAMNALGEVYYLVDMPTRSSLDRKTKLDEVDLDLLAWQSGRTVHWAIAEPSRRTARPDPFENSDFDGSYSPRSSSNSAGLSSEQLAAETKEIEKFCCYIPQHFRKINEGWDMRRRLEVDFAGDDRSTAGENVVVVQCGLDEGEVPCIRRYTRCRVPNPAKDSTSDSPSGDETQKGSLFGAVQGGISEEPSWSFNSMKRSPSAFSDHLEEIATIEEWRTSTFTLGGLKAPQIAVTAIDLSTYALLTTLEDPLLCIGGSSVTSSPTSSPLPQMPRPSAPSDVPGQRARLFAAGTKTGTIIVWNMRDPTSNNSVIETAIKPVRIIYTDSPQISCLALSALYLVHGGNDGLVQAWDPLASTTDPIRTLNSRFSSRARRRLVQAEASPQGVGINLFAAGAIFLDPDPTVLRGMVSLGTHLRYWSYSSSAADQYKTTKRRLRRSGRRSSSNLANNNINDVRFSGTGRGALKDYIANEKLELEQEKSRRRKEEERLAGRFGLDLLGPGATEEEVLAYATMLSEEAARSDEQRRRSESNSAGDRTPTTTTTTGFPASEPQQNLGEDERNAEILDPDIAEAIRLSLQDSTTRTSVSDGAEIGGGPSSSSSSSADFSIRVRESKCMASSSSSPSPSPLLRAVGSNDGDDAEREDLDSDLDFALRLSLAEEESRVEGSGSGSGSGSGNGKGKGKERGY